MRYSRQLTRIALSILLITITSPSTAARRSFESSIDQICRDALAHGVAGMSIGVEHHHRVTLRACGEADRDAHTPVTPSTVFHIASISKYILAATIVQLAEQRRVRTGDDVRTYIPEAPTHGRRVTVGELLS